MVRREDGEFGSGVGFMVGLGTGLGGIAGVFGGDQGMGYCLQCGRCRSLQPSKVRRC